MDQLSLHNKSCFKGSINALLWTHFVVARRLKLIPKSKLQTSFDKKIANKSSGVNILTLFRYFGCGTVLKFWYFSEKFFERSHIVSLRKLKTFPKFEERLIKIRKISALCAITLILLNLSTFILKLSCEWTMIHYILCSKWSKYFPIPCLVKK